MAQAQQIEELQGTSIIIDDGRFSGCFHDAFEGLAETAADGSVKQGAQGISRTKGVLYGKGSGFDIMTLDFSLDKQPAGVTVLAVTGLDDHFPEKNPLRLKLNGTVLAEELIFPGNDLSATGNARYLIGWDTQEISIPAGLLKKGANTLRLVNPKSVFASSRWHSVFIDQVVFNFTEAVVMSVPRNDTPVFYYGLQTGIELNLWPAINSENRICLVTDGDIEFNFSATFPKALVPETVKGRMPVVLHIETDAVLEITGIDGTVWPATQEGGITRFAHATEIRVIKHETPHSAQGIVCFMRATGDFSGKRLTAWFEAAGMPARKQEFPLRAVSIEPVPGRDKLDFLFSIWGGQVPQEPERMQSYINLIRAAGFNQMFTGANPELNRQLQAAGFKVYPRYGWFGHQFKLTEENRQFAAVGADGKELTKDFCPQAILKNTEDPELGKFFQRARDMAAQPHINGICVDFECAPVWCWCDKCLERFSRESGIALVNRAAAAAGGEHEAAYRDFGRKLNRELLQEVRRIMQEQKPELRYFSLASASDMPAYWWDGRTQGRHAIRELVKFADEIAASAYFYEIPGGLKSVRALISVIRDQALQAGREVDAGIIAPLASTVGEMPRYRGTFMRAELLRLLILLVGTGHGHSLALFRGDCFNGEHYLASRQALAELVRLQPYIDSGIDRSFELEARPLEQELTKVELSIAHHLLSRLEWRPDIVYQHDAVQLWRDDSGQDRIVLLFNYSPEPMQQQVKILGTFDPKFKVTDFITGSELGEKTRLELEKGKFIVEVPARNCRILRLTSMP